MRSILDTCTWSDVSKMHFDQQGKEIEFKVHGKPGHTDIYPALTVEVSLFGHFHSAVLRGIWVSQTSWRSTSNMLIGKQWMLSKVWWLVAGRCHPRNFSDLFLSSHWFLVLLCYVSASIRETVHQQLQV